MSDLVPRMNVPAAAARIAAKVALGSVLVFGPLLVAAIDEIMPALRKERLEGFAEALHGRVLGLSADTLTERLQDPDRFGLLDDGLWQAARVSSRERLAHIANIVANGLTRDHANAEDRRYLLQLLNELNDVEVLELCAYGRESQASRHAFYEQHKEALEYRPASFGDAHEVLNRQSIRHNYDQHLARLGLLDDVYNATYKKPLEIDGNGKPKGTSRRLSTLGRYLLRELGHPADMDGKAT